MNIFKYSNPLYKTGIGINPLLPQGATAGQDDFVIYINNDVNTIIVSGREHNAWSPEEIRNIIDGLEKALEIHETMERL